MHPKYADGHISEAMFYSTYAKPADGMIRKATAGNAAVDSILIEIGLSHDIIKENGIVRAGKVGFQFLIVL